MVKDTDIKDIEWTSISVTKPVLRWVANIKNLIEYYAQRKMTNSEAVGIICAIADYSIAKDLGLTKEDFLTFFSRKIKVFSEVDSDKEIQNMLDEMKSFGIFKNK